MRLYKNHTHARRLADKETTDMNATCDVTNVFIDSAYKKGDSVNCKI